MSIRVDDDLQVGAGQLRAVNARDEGAVLTTYAVVREAEPDGVGVCGRADHLVAQKHVVGARGSGVASGIAESRIEAARALIQRIAPDGRVEGACRVQAHGPISHGCVGKARGIGKERRRSALLNQRA